MNFFDSQMGRRFFEGQLPQLIKALQGISDKLSRPGDGHQTVRRA